MGSTGDNQGATAKGGYMFQKILVALDRSMISEHVFDNAISLAKATGANLLLLHVLCSEEEDCPKMPTLTTLEYFPVDSTLFENYQKNWQIYENQGLKLLQSLAEKATVAGVNTEFTQKVGNPGRAICEVGQTWGADLVLLGRRGRSGLNELLLGSVSNYVLHHASCSVLAVQGRTQTKVETPPNDQTATAS